MKIATYNVNGISSRLPVLLRWLAEEQPDVACLQELKAPDEKFPLMDIQLAGYEAVWIGQKSWNGVALLVKGYEITNVVKGLPGDPADEQSRYLEATVNGIRICCLYLPNGNPAPGPKFDYKLAWFKRFHHRAKELLELKLPLVLVGDFNVIPAEADAYKPERWVNDALFRPETRAAFEGLKALGFTDALRHLNPDAVIYTYWDYFRDAYNRNAGLRIDHFLLNDSALSLLQSAGVHTQVRGWEKTSDHAPVWITLQP